MEEIDVPHAFRTLPSFGIVLALLAPPSLTSCVVAAVGGAAAGGAYVAGQERGAGTQVSDTTIRTQINDKWLQYNTDMYSQLTLSVVSGRVLITGAVSNPEWKPEAVRLAWQIDGVKEVDDEIQLADKSSLSDAARDDLIILRLRNALLFDGQIRSTNYNIDAVNGVLYVSGYARTQGELDKVTDYARNIPNVKRVVSYVRVRPGAGPNAEDNATQTTAPAGPAPVVQGTPSASPPAAPAAAPATSPAAVPPAPSTAAPATPSGGNAPIQVTPLQ
jgi:osmotically-inducible protein OsmY